MTGSGRSVKGLRMWYYNTTVLRALPRRPKVAR